MFDASNYAFGVVFSQRVNKFPHVIAYAFRTLDATQLNYTTIEKELLAIVFALDKFISHMLGYKINHLYRPCYIKIPIGEFRPKTKIKQMDIVFTRV